jgi:hypothetical protein
MSHRCFFPTIAAGICIVLCLIAVPVYAMQSVVIDSLAGQAEVQRAGKSDWLVVRQGSALYNNDILRVLDNSHARLQWQNGSLMFAGANSQMLINLYGDSTTNLFSKHITVFMGAIYCIVKEVLPQGTFARYDTKVYTPTATLAIRGTSFLVDVAKTNGTTDVAVINGTVLVGNILRKEQTFLAAGYKTSVAMNDAPLQPQAVLTADIDSLKLWVPPPIIDEETRKQISKAKRDYYIITGNLEDKLLIIPLANSSNYHGPWDLSRKMAEFIGTRISQNQPSLTILTADSAGSDAMPAGRNHKARFVLTGDIQSFEIVQLAEISAQADKYKESCIARVKFHMQLIDVANNRVVYETDAGGEVAARNLKANTWPEVAKMPLDLQDAKFAATILAQAINQAVDDTYARIAVYLK